MKNISKIFVGCFLFILVFMTQNSRIYAASIDSIAPTVVTSENCSGYDLPEKYAGYYAITNVNELYGFAELINERKMTDANAVVINDIEINSELYKGGTFSVTDSLIQWSPIGSSEEYGFTGVFDGNGKTISGIYCKSIYAGFMGYCRDGVIKNLTIKESFFDDSSDYGSGGICSYNSGSLFNCIVDKCSLSGKYNGGITGYNEGTIEGCETDNLFFSNNDNAGICGYNGNGNIKKCINNSDVTGKTYAAGITNSLGQISGEVSECKNNGNIQAVDSYGCTGGICSVTQLWIYNCINYGKITGVNYVGGIVGSCSYVLDYKYLHDNSNYGEIIGSGEYVGGIVGRSNMTITKCINLGKVEGTKYTGGISGSIEIGSVSYSHNKGDVSGTIYIGGINGYNDWRNTTYCYNSGKIESTGNYVGGINGYIGGGTTENSYNTGQIICTQDHAGGINGYNKSTINKCYSIGNISGLKYVGALVGENAEGDLSCSFYLENSATDGAGAKQNAIGSSEKGTNVNDVNTFSSTENEFKSGKVAFLLNRGLSDVWGQIIGSDDYPVLSSDTVYYGYADCDATDMLYTNETVLDKAGHAYGNPVFTWSEDGKRATVAVTCANDSTHTASYDATITSTVKTAATCTIKGKTTYTAAYGNYTDTKDVQDIAIDTKNHIWDKNYTVDLPATKTSDGSKSIHCSACGEKKNITVISAIGSDEKIIVESQKITIAKIKVYKAKNLKRKKVVFSLKAKTNGNGKLACKVIKGKSKYISVSKSGKVTLKKGCKKGTYKIRITASATSKFKKTTKVVSIKVK